MLMCVFQPTVMAPSTYKTTTEAHVTYLSWVKLKFTVQYKKNQKHAEPFT